MTEAMSRREIEDVLSSIRRLVAQDPTRQGQSAPEQPAEAAPGKLILTSALRVPDDAPAADAETPAPPVTQDDTGDDALATDQAAPDAKGADQAAEPKQEVPTEAPTAIHMLRAMNRRDAEDRAAAAPLADIADANPDTPAGAEPDLALEATLARLERALSQQDAGFSRSEPVPLRAVQGTKDGQPANDTAAVSDEAVIDEAMLYQIVADIVRQELQGELGERITRNIRKLVRAEVARELQLRKP
ncbi:hypothetical protein [Roseinatronobacter alkalisoli]|uniref:DUF2497 domain-containing protein n=1 Tax=Roseinatronobacter alkalisoli TaxID=3028235 RepID=A0ABT5T7R7_9RHOB|nr:hypothetical protein [Roseinatronobacter sp. HJB301]MDD7971170.1 hypothetical protein [Roseinatronobacter sp. HJB301]